MTSVLLFWLSDQPLCSISVRYERYVASLEQHGYRPIVIATPQALKGFNCTQQMSVSQQDLDSVEFWKQFPNAVAMGVTWLSHASALSAMKQAGLPVIALADSDGQVGFRAHPKQTFRRNFFQHTTWSNRIKSVKYWLQIYLKGHHNRLDQSVLESVAHSDQILFCSEPAVQAFKYFLSRCNSSESSSKLSAVPYPVDFDYIHPLSDHKDPNSFVAIGRWDDPQKNPKLLQQLATFFQENNCILNVIGPNGNDLFQNSSQIRYHGILPAPQIREILLRTQTLLIPSRWESGPIVMNEALCSGCSIIAGEHIPAAVEATSVNSCGTVVKGLCYKHWIRAIHQEKSQWSCGKRNPKSIAEYFQNKFSIPAAAKLLDNRIRLCLTSL